MRFRLKSAARRFCFDDAEWDTLNRRSGVVEPDAVVGKVVHSAVGMPEIDVLDARFRAVSHLIQIAEQPAGRPFLGIGDNRYRAVNTRL